MEPVITSPVTLRWREDQVAVVTLDVPGESHNTMKLEFIPLFLKIFEEVSTRPGLVGVVITSGKVGSFLAGADLSLVRSLHTSGQAPALAEQAHTLLSKLDTFPVPVVAAIQGACLGGGLELALACHGRICADDPDTVLGLPEVQLGLIPAGGGTQRLPRLIGIAPALDLLLTGRQVKTRAALKMGLVDEVVRPSILEACAVARVHTLSRARQQSMSLSPWRHLQESLSPRTDFQQALMESWAGRKILFSQARKQTLEKTHGNYPAPMAILDVVEKGMATSVDEGLKLEAEAFTRLVATPEAVQLVNLFFAVNALKKDTGVEGEEVHPEDVHKVGVLGAGLMGAGISFVTVDRAGLDVRLKDRDGEGVGRGMAAIYKLLENRVKRRSLSRKEADQILARVTPTLDLKGFEGCQVVIEAVFEDLALKHRLLQDVEKVCSPRTIFASNTSSIPITRIAEASNRPETVIGLHYFSPVEKMPLLEIIITPHTAPWVVATCVELGKIQGKTVIVVRDGVGFYTSRILGPYMNEAGHILSEGVPVERIDEALVGWGFPVGPLTLLDEVGIDVAEKVGHIMLEAFGDRLQVPRTVAKLAASGRKGRKNARGFYRYEKGTKGKKKVDTTVYADLGINPQQQIPTEEISRRCALQMINEAVRCLEEGILRSPRDGDVGAIFGLGFPPFRGGPFRYVDEVGADTIVTQLQWLADVFGKRFEPAALLVEMARTGRKFYE